MPDLPTPSQKVRLVVLESMPEAAYSTYVEAVSEFVVTLAEPIAGGQPVTLSPGQPVRVEYSLEDGRVSFTTRVIGSGMDRIPLLRLEAPDPGEIGRLQQRDFFRQDATLNLTFTVISIPNKSFATGIPHESRTRDISASGAQILCPEQYPAGTRLEIHLNLNGEVLHCLGEVIRPLQQTGNGRWWVAVRFLGLTDRDRDQIVRCVFDIQRDLRNRGL